MKSVNIHIIFVFSVILLAGCARHEPSSTRDERPDNYPEDIRKNQGGTSFSLQNQTIGSRFYASNEESREIINIKASEAEEDFEYFRPDEQIDAQTMIPAGGNLKQNKDPGTSSPSNKKIITPGQQVYFKNGRTSPEVFFSAIFDNDMFNYTDYYYTSGIGFEFYHPAISSFPLVQVLPGLKYGLNYYGVTLTQNLYTPRNLIYDYVLDDDRPFAAYLMLGFKRISLSPEYRRRLKSELSLGIIGPAALGGAAQDLIHDDKPVGWVNQVQNDFIINYNIRYDQGIFSGRHAELAIAAGGQAGTLYDNISAGLFFQAGSYNSRYESIFQTTAHQKSFKKRIRYFISLEVMNKMVFYDATLQGGMFNRESVYTLEGSRVRHYVLTGTASAGLGFGRYSLEAEQVILTPEFNGGLYHMWFRIKNIIYLN